MMTSAIAKAATKAIASVKANALSKFLAPREESKRPFVTFYQMGSVFAIALGP